MNETQSSNQNILDNIRFEAFTAVTMKNSVFSVMKSQLIPQQETYFFSTTQPEVKIWDFHDGYYEERDREVGCSERHYNGWGSKKYIIGYEGS
jgi:hypothetical protein